MDWVFGKGRRKEKDVTIVQPQDETKPYLDEHYVRDKIIDADLEKLVELPQGLDYNEWLATHTISFFEHINLMYGTVAEYCTMTGCASMTGPNNTHYLWFDEKGKKCKCAAPQYVDYVMTYTQKTIHDENVFPTKYGNVFPASFEALVKKIHRYLFHVIAHVYQAHYQQLQHFALHPHLNTLFYHFTIFNRKFNLVDDKESEIMDDLYEKLKLGHGNMFVGNGKQHQMENTKVHEENKENLNSDQRVLTEQPKMTS